MKTLHIVAAVSALFAPAFARAELKLPAIISDHMVLQADAAVPIWGWADAGEKVTVSLAGQSQSAQAGADGTWRVTLAPLAAGSEPRALTVQGSNTLTVNDVLVGEVWLASGQSNMAFQVSRGLNAEQEIAAAKSPQIRMFSVQRNPQRTSQADCIGQWQICSPETVGHFSAVAYFFGRELNHRLKTPVGLVNSSVGGTDIAAWTSEEVQAKVPELKAQLDRWATEDAAYDPVEAATQQEKQLAAWKKRVVQAKEAGRVPPRKPRSNVQPRLDANYPANLYNGMIAPLIPYAVRGAIWYQGEHNTATAERASLYRMQLPLLIADWRARWGTDFPFAWVQLPNYDRKDFRPEVREAMLQSLRVKNTGMAITIDVGDPADNHPKNKQEVGRRLALWALGTVYHQQVPATSGPLVASHAIRDGEVALTFDHADGGLMAQGSEELRGFAIAGEDRQWKPARARIEGKTVVVSHPDIGKPVAVRYAWASNPDCNLFNGAGLPASPFRTDDWQASAQ
jgi:carbohydrate esterase-like sialic acid-specific acetylesterase